MIPGFLIAIITFPGVIVHEFAHQLFCRWMRVAIHDVCYFRIGNPSGYVIHEIPRTMSQSIWISVGPFFVNTIVGALIAAPGAIPVLQFDTGTPLDYFLIWLGVSIAMHAFPSSGDAASIWAAVTRERGFAIAKVVAVPVVGLIYIGAIGSVFWLDLIYGVGVALGLPTLIIHLLA